MASCSTGQIGALMAESFCERILSCAKQVVHRHRLSYKAEEYSMVVILRMNRAFMEYMRKHEKDYEPRQVASIEFDCFAVVRGSK